MDERKKQKLKLKTNPRTIQPNRFQPRALVLWLFLVSAIIMLWSFGSTDTRIKETWTMNQLLKAAQQGQIVRGTIRSDTVRGPEWYIVAGEANNPAKLDTSISKADQELEPKLIAFEAQGRLTPERFDTLNNSTSGMYLVERPSSTVLTDLLLSIVPFLFIVGLLYLLFMHQIRAAGRGAMSFGKSKARLMTPNREVITFADVAGCDEAKQEVSEIVEFLKDPKKFRNLGARIPKGVLMVGPPGTGKTLLAKAVAGEADVNFFSISGSDFVEMFVGIGAARVRDMFEQGRKNAPCIMFIDEIDAVGRKRGAGLGGGNDEREQTLNSILVEMDGFDGREEVIIIAATNRPDVLDSALLRPGRFDRQVVIDLPDLNGRVDILKVHSKKIKLATETDLTVAARNAAGFSGADLKNLLNEGALIAARYDAKEVTNQHLDEAREKISYGRERRKLMDDEDKRIVACHEAGHALVQMLIDDGHLPVHKVTIIPRGQSLGSTMFTPKKDFLNYSKSRLLNQICCGMGGRVAELIVLKEITNGASGDIKSATKLARHMVCDWGMASLGTVAYGDNQEHIFLGSEIARNQNYSEQTAQKIDQAVTEIIQSQYERAYDLVSKHLKALDGIIDALLEYETIEGKHVKEILEHGSLQSEVFKSLYVTKSKHEPLVHVNPEAGIIAPSPTEPII